jgi:hypothetical protein
MRGANEELQGGRELSYVTQKDALTGSLFSRILDAVNTLAKNAGVAAVGNIPPPPPVDSITVQGTTSEDGSTITCPSEILHFTIQHNQAIKKGIKYFSEIDTSPYFTKPHVIDHGASRSAFLHLPTYLNDGITQQTYYLRSYAQYPGSDPTKPTVLGGRSGAVKIQMTGSSGTTLLTSAGSGTASPTGEQGGQGLGINLSRPAPGPKRNVK